MAGGRQRFLCTYMHVHAYAYINRERERWPVMWYSTPKEIAPLELHIPILLPFYLTVMEITYCPLNRGCWLYYSNAVCTKCGLAKVLTGLLVHRCTVTVTSNVAQRFARSRHLCAYSMRYQSAWVNHSCVGFRITYENKMGKIQFKKIPLHVIAPPPRPRPPTHWHLKVGCVGILNSM